MLFSSTKPLQLLQLCIAACVGACRPMAIRIQECITVTGGGADKFPWIIKPEAIKTVENIKFVKLSKVDTGFARFVSNTTSLRNMDFLHTMVHKRTDATCGLTGCSQGPALFEDAPEMPRRVKLRKKADAAALIEPDTIVTLAMPAIVDNDVEQAAASSIKVLANTDEKSCVWMELTDTALSYIRCALRASQVQEEEAPKREKFGKGINFRADRNVFIAARMKDGEITKKAFKFEKGGDDEEKKKALGRAKAWADGESDDELCAHGAAAAAGME